MSTDAKTHTEAPADLDRQDRHFRDTVDAVRTKLSPARTTTFDEGTPQEFTMNWNVDPYNNSQGGANKGWLGRLSHDAYRGFSGPHGQVREYRDMTISGNRGPVSADVVVHDADQGRSRTTLKARGGSGRHSVVIDRDEHGRTVGPAKLVSESKTGRYSDRTERKLGPVATRLAKMAAKYALKR